MDEGKRDIAKAFARMLVPGPRKLAVFALLAAALLFLPLYPVHVDTYIGEDEASADELERSGTKVTSLYTVLEGDFNWTSVDITMRQMGLFVTYWDYHVSYYDAGPAFISVYIALGMLAYCLSCYYVESDKEARKRRD